MRASLSRAGWVAWRELGAWFAQPAAWVFLAAFVGLAAALGLRGFFERGVADLRDFFLGLRWACAFLAPAATMRLVAEERRLGTLELLLGLPIAPWEAVLGKFLAALALVAAGLGLSALFPLCLLGLGPFDGGQIVAGYLGALLLACGYVAAGLFASALTRSQAVAFVLGAGVCLLLSMLGDPALMDQLQRLLPRPALTALANLGAGEHQQAFTRGLVDLRDVLWFLLLGLAFLFWTTLALERREPDRREPWLAAGLSLAALLLAQAVLAEPLLRLRLDLTGDGRNTLAPALRALLGEVEGQLTVRAYLSERPPEQLRPHLRRMRDLLQDVAEELGPRCDLALIDPDAAGLDTGEKQALAQQASRDGVLETLLTVQGEGDRLQRAPVYAGLALLLGDRPPAAIPFAPGSADLEADLATALQRVLYPRLRVGLSGEETANYRQVRAALGASHALQDLDLAQIAAVPSQVALLVHAAPLPPDGPTVEKLRAYVAGGGRLLLLAESHWLDRRRHLAEPFAAGPLAEALAGWGLRLGPGLVACPSERTWTVPADGREVVGPYPWYLTVGAAEQPPESPLTLGPRPALLPYVGEVGRHEPLPEGARWEPLLVSAPGWAPQGVADIHPLHELRVEGAPAPRVVCAAVSGLPGTSPARRGRVVLLADADLCRDGNQLEGAPGVALVVALANWAVDRALGLRGRGAAPPLAPGAAAHEGTILALFYGWLPGGVLLGGLALVRLRHARAERRAAALRDARAAAVGKGPGP